MAGKEIMRDGKIIGNQESMRQVDLRHIVLKEKRQKQI